jgi:hypothetical protein
MLFSRSTKFFLLFSEQNVVGQNCTENSYSNSIQIHSNINRIHINIASEKNKTKFISFINLARKPNSRTWPMAIPARSSRPSQPGQVAARGLVSKHAPRSARLGRKRPVAGADTAPRPQPGPGPGILPDARARLGFIRPSVPAGDLSRSSSSDGHERKS